MLRKPSFKQAIYLHAVMLGLILTALGGAAAVTVQQTLRHGADQPQTQMADLSVSQLLSGEKPVDFVSPKHVDMGQSLEPFVIFYNDAGRPEDSTGYLDGTVPAPPSGVFDYLRKHSSDHFT